MEKTETLVAAHYTTEDLLGRIARALTEVGADPANLRPDDLKPVDEFHTGGLEATKALLDQLQIDAETRVLDIGSGLGGTARFVTETYGAGVVGVDLTPVFVETALELSRMVGLEDQVTYLTGSATALPLEPDSVDLALMFHVGMNIADKDAIFAETAKVLTAGGTFALFDVMQMTPDAELPFPFPWAEKAEQSFTAAPEIYEAAAKASGFSQIAKSNRKDFALDFFERAFAAVEAAGKPSPLGIHLLMRETALQKLKNYVAAVEQGLLAPVEMIFRAPA